MAIDVRPPDDLGPRSTRPRLTLAHPLAWVGALIVSSLMWAALGYAIYSLVSA